MCFNTNDGKYPFLPIVTHSELGGVLVASSALLPSPARYGPPAVACFMCLEHMRRRHSSHDSASHGAEASVKAARFLRAA